MKDKSNKQIMERLSKKKNKKTITLTIDPQVYEDMQKKVIPHMKKKLNRSVSVSEVIESYLQILIEDLEENKNKKS